MHSFRFLVVVSCCMAGALAKTRCEGHRELESARNAPLNFIPECSVEGEYAELQCFVVTPRTVFCMCMTPDGRQIRGPSTSIKTCDCHIHHDRQLAEAKHRDGVFLPTCNEDGTFAKKQCNTATGFCWCSDAKGNKISEESNRSITC